MQRSEQGEEGGTRDAGEWRDWRETEFPYFKGVLVSLIRAGFSRGKVKKLITKLWLSRYGNEPLDVVVRGAKYRLDFRDNAPALKVMFSSYYDTGELDRLREACEKSGGAFVDVGANMGYYSMDLATKGIRVIAIEPNPHVFARLLFHVEANGVGHLVSPVEMCIAEPGTHTLSFADHGTGSLVDLHSAPHSVEVRGDTLLNILARLKVEKVSGLKIDIEGTEDAALLPFFENAPRSLWPECMAVEHSSRDYWDTDLIGFLLAHGYETVLKKRANTVLRLRGE